MTKKLNYKAAGVNIEAGNDLVEQIKPLTQKTAQGWSKKPIGGFGAVLDLGKAGFKDPLIVSSTDGVGTKLKCAIDAKNMHFIGFDLVGMCVNDLLVEGAKPLQFLDYYATGKLKKEEATTVISSIADACLVAKCHLAGGETAEMPGFYGADEFDLAGFVIGAVERESYENRPSIEEGDIVMGFASNGIHSNGYSLVRAVLEQANIDLRHDQTKLSDHVLVRDAILAPTRIYRDLLLGLFDNHIIKSAAHITGGGISENLQRILPKNINAHIDLSSIRKQPIFTWLQEKGDIDTKDMYHTFNMGVGIIAIADKSKKKAIIEYAKKCKEEVFILGDIKKGDGQVLLSQV